MRPILTGSLLTAFVPLMLTACGPSPVTQVNQTENKAEAANDTETVNYVAAVEALSDDERKAVFFRAIRDAGVPCQMVIKAEKTAPWQGLPSWLADCDTGDQHLVQLSPDGSAKVVSRTTR